MPIVVLVIALVAYVYSMIAYPSIRRPGLLLGAAIALGLAAYFWLDEAETREAARRITAEELEVDELAIERTIRGASLSGRLLNRSDEWRLRDMTLSLRLRDCAVDAPALTDCPVIAEATAIARPEAPPGQIRGFTTRFLFDGLPPPSEDHRWDWEIVGIRATR